jgi:mono/diheme cytochrome c family protein
MSVLLHAGCRQEMAADPKHESMTQSTFFPDGRSARLPVEGTVPQGSLEDGYLYVPVDARGFPLPVTPELLAAGRERFAIFCSVCHGLLGDGDGMIPRRGFPHPPSFHIDRLRTAPEGYFFRIITDGRNPMPEYGTRIDPADRWAIIAYIRALQLSQNVRADDLPSSMQQELSGSEGSAP